MLEKALFTLVGLLFMAGFAVLVYDAMGRELDIREERASITCGQYPESCGGSNGN